MIFYVLESSDSVFLVFQLSYFADVDLLVSNPNQGSNTEFNNDRLLSVSTQIYCRCFNHNYDLQENIHRVTSVFTNIIKTQWFPFRCDDFFQRPLSLSVRSYSMMHVWYYQDLETPTIGGIQEMLLTVVISLQHFHHRLCNNIYIILTRSINQYRVFYFHPQVLPTTMKSNHAEMV